MGLRAETRDELRKETVDKIHGQPMDQDLTKLEKQLISIAASIPSALCRGNHGHAGIIVEPTKYLTMTMVQMHSSHQTTSESILQDLH
jgi:hypothetical protein